MRLNMVRRIELQILRMNVYFGLAAVLVSFIKFLTLIEIIGLVNCFGWLFTTILFSASVVFHLSIQVRVSSLALASFFCNINWSCEPDDGENLIDDCK